MKSSLGISSFLDKISSLSRSIVFLCFFALIPEEGFLISPCDSLSFLIWTFLKFRQKLKVLLLYSLCYFQFRGCTIAFSRDSFLYGNNYLLFVKLNLYQNAFFIILRVISSWHGK